MRPAVPTVLVIASLPVFRSCAAVPLHFLWKQMIPFSPVPQLPVPSLFSNSPRSFPVGAAFLFFSLTIPGEQGKYEQIQEPRAFHKFSGLFLFPPPASRWFICLSVLFHFFFSFVAPYSPCLKARLSLHALIGIPHSAFPLVLAYPPSVGLPWCAPVRQFNLFS